MTMKLIYQLSLTGLLFSLLSACSENDNASEDVEIPLRPVRYITAEAIETRTIRTFSGLSKSGQESNLSFRVAGPIQKLAVEVGDQLEKGQMIAEIDPSQYQLEAQQAKASLAQAEATLRNAEANFDRIKGLYENNNISRNELDSARATAESSQAQVSASRKALELARLNVSYTRLKASEACDIADVQTEVNENITAGQTIVAVTCGEKLEVELGVPESTIASIQRGMDADVAFSSIPDTNFPAKVTEVGVASTTGTTYPVTVELNEKPAGLRSGLAAQVSFALNINGNKADIILPAVAVGEDVNGRYVFIVNKTSEQGVGEIKRQPVKIGELTIKGLEIMEGVKAGDKVVIAGVNVIRPGLKVLID